MPKPFKGTINLDIRDSTPDWEAFLPDKAPEGAPNVLVVLYDDTGCAAPAVRPCIGYDGGDAVSSEYTPKFEFTGGRIVKVVFDVADDAYIEVERELAAALARD